MRFSKKIQGQESEISNTKTMHSLKRKLKEASQSNKTRGERVEALELQLTKIKKNDQAQQERVGALERQLREMQSAPELTRLTLRTRP
ncbi:MAG TPA: hypothetical protein VGJ00_01555 [Rhabdochlamydiaceae bacterium]|jgi:predicted  nucleic acid-binding Zn-ribbon protein